MSDFDWYLISLFSKIKKMPRNHENAKFHQNSSTKYFLCLFVCQLTDWCFSGEKIFSSN